VYIRFRGKVLTEPLPTNDTIRWPAIIGDKQTDERDLRSTPLRWAQMTYMDIPSFIKIGSGIQKVIGRSHRHTDSMEIV
jgi:hypothetical protein